MISDGDKVIIGFNDNFKLVTVKSGKTGNYLKHSFLWDNCIGKPFG